MSSGIKLGRQRVLIFSIAVVGVIASMFGVVTVDANTPEGSILEHAKVPTEDDTASSKYAVIAAFTEGKSERLLLDANDRPLANKSNSPIKRVDGKGMNGESLGGADIIVDPDESLKGDIKIRYTNVGSYRGRSLDFDMLITDWKKAGFHGGEYMHFFDYQIGLRQGGYDYISLDGTYVYSDTKEPATDLTGSYMTINDLDMHQFVSFDETMWDSIDTIYASENTRVSYWKNGSNGKTKHHVGANFYENLDSQDEEGIVTLLVSGYKFSFDWAKDWTKPTSTGTKHNLNRELNWQDEKNGQLFEYLAEKPVRTEILEPTKKIIDSDGKQVDSNTVTVPETYTYNVHHTVPREDPRFYYTAYEMQDEIHDALDIERVRVYDRADKNITDKFDISTRNNTVTVKAPASMLNNPSFYGQDYRVEIRVKVNMSDDVVDFAGDSDSFTVSNKATVKIDNQSKTTNEVNTTVQLPQTDIGMKHIQIYTDRADQGLPVLLTLNLDNQFDTYSDETIDIGVYRTNENDKLLMTETVKLSDITDNEQLELLIPSDELAPAQEANYKAVIKDYDDRYISIPDDAVSIDTDGYTATEGTLTEQDGEPTSFTGVVMTEREIGEDIETYEEAITIDYVTDQTVKSGYGYDVYGKVAYENDIMDDVTERFDIHRSTDMRMEIDNGLLDYTLAFYNADSSASSMELVVDDSEDTDTHSVRTYTAPTIFLDQQSGMAYTAEQKDNGEVSGEAIDAGERLYAPVWIDSLGTYEMTLTNERPLGVHRMDVKTTSTVDVQAYMFSHTDSETPEDDELLIHPLSQDDIPANW